MRLTALCLLTCGLAIPALAQEGPLRPASHCFAVAQAAPRILPAAWGAEVPLQDVRIRYLDHASFAIVSGGVMAVTDYTGWIGNLDVVPDVVTMNNAHSTHWTARPDDRIAHVLPGWPQDGLPARHDLDLGAMLVRSVTTDTRGPFGEGARADGNSIFVFEAGGLCIGHLGHLHQIPNDEQYAEIGRLDVVMVPVDGGYTLALDDMAAIVKRLRASVVIPMHWFSGASLQQFTADMAREFEIVETGVSEIDLSPSKLPGRPTVLILDPAPIP